MMGFKLLDMAQQRWRRINALKLLPLVRAGVKFVDEVQAEFRRSASIKKSGKTPPDHAPIHNI